MNLNNAFQHTLDKLKKKEQLYADKVQKGSKDFSDYHYMSFFSGALAGFRFVWQILDGDVTHKEYDELERELLYEDIKTKGN